MADNKTQVLEVSVADHLRTIEPAARRLEAEQLDQLFCAHTGEIGEVWSGGIIGYGRTSYKNARGKEATWMQSGFAVRRTALTLYLMAGAARFEALLSQLGPHKLGASCLYLKRLSDVDQTVLSELIRTSHEAAGRGDIEYGQ